MFKRVPIKLLQEYSRIVAVDIPQSEAIILRHIPKVKPEKKEDKQSAMRKVDAYVGDLIAQALKEIQTLDISNLDMKDTNTVRPTVSDEFDGHFFPAIETSADRIVATGPSGSGKTTFCAELIIHYLSLFQNSKVFIISSLNEDESLTELENYYGDRIIRFPINEMFGDPENMIDVETLTDSMVFFDDVDTIMASNIRSEVLSLRDYLLEQHRHFNIFLLITTHLLTNFRETRRMLNETRKLVVFPGSGADYHILNFLTRFMGIGVRKSKEIINKIDQSSRWILISKTAPLYMVSENVIKSI